MKPILQAILLADHVYRDAATGKHIVAGVFHDLIVLKPEDIEKLQQQAVKTPVVAGGMQAGSPYAYISLTGVRGDQVFSLRYVSLDDDRVMFHAELPVKCEDPLETVEIIAPLPSLPHNLGIFALELLWKDEPVGSFRVRVRNLEVGGSQDGANR